MGTFESAARTGDVDISAEEAQARQRAGALVLDVREPDEWLDGHIAGAKHVPLGELEARLGELDRGAEIVAVCHTGYRSGLAARALYAAGFSRVWNLRGGMVAWERARQPVTRG